MQIVNTGSETQYLNVGVDGEDIVVAHGDDLPMVRISDQKGLMVDGAAETFVYVQDIPNLIVALQTAYNSFKGV